MIGTVSEIRSALYPPDVVVAQDPPPATQTAEIRLLVNRGEDRATYIMPDLIGLNGERAADVMRIRGFACPSHRSPLPRRSRLALWCDRCRPVVIKCIPATPSHSR
jgi:hypothetical protein